MPTDDPPADDLPPEAQPADGAAPTSVGDPAAVAPRAPLLELADPLPPVVDTDDRLAEAVAAVAAGTGPVAIDAERASGYRYSSRAYLIQVRRAGAGTHLIDPTAFADQAALAAAIGDAEWVLHAATQDLPCLREVGLRPAALFDTELAGRLLGYPRVGLATLVEELLGFRMRKEHSAADWSTRPLPESWLEYAALDVEVLVELRDVLAAQLAEQDKTEWARQEFEALLDFSPTTRGEPWRRTSGTHRVRGRRALAAVRELWLARDEIAARRDVTPGRILPDAALIAAANALPRDRRTLLATPGFHGRGAERYAGAWVEAIRRAVALPEHDLPAVTQRYDGPPPPRAWAERDPEAAARLAAARTALADVSERHAVPVENILTPDFVRRILWEPPPVRDRAALVEEVRGRLADLGARPWQIELTADLLANAILDA